MDLLIYCGFEPIYVHKVKNSCFFFFFFAKSIFTIYCLPSNIIPLKIHTFVDNFYPKMHPLPIRGIIFVFLPLYASGQWVTLLVMSSNVTPFLCL